MDGWKAEPEEESWRCHAREGEREEIVHDLVLTVGHVEEGMSCHVFKVGLRFVVEERYLYKFGNSVVAGGATESSRGGTKSRKKKKTPVENLI